jgi:hypothetical protein
VPAAYLVKDPTKKREGTLVFIREPSVRDIVEGAAEELLTEPQGDWKDRLK